MKNAFSFLLMFSGIMLVEAQIVNIESQRLSSDTTGWHGRYQLSANYVKNTNELLNLNNDLSAEYVQKKYSWLFLNSLNASLSNLATLENSLFFHVRYNYRQTKRLTYEALIQYQKNVPLKIDHRILTGAGPRLGIVKKKKFELYAGSILLFEHDNELETDIEHNNLRLSNYLSLEYELPEKLQWVAVAYYQPRLEYWKDFRATLQTQIQFRIFKSLSFASTGSVSYDAFPVQEIPELTINWTNGIALGF